MIKTACYEEVLPSSLVGTMQDYCTQAEYRTIEQDHLGSSYQGVYVHMLPNDHFIKKSVIKTLLDMNSKYYKYDLFGTFEIQMLKYTAGNHYNWHSDYGVSENPNGPRKLSLSIQLSSYWEYSGGDVVLRDWYNQKQYMSKEVGTVMLFDSRVAHKVMPIEQGERYAIVAWAHGPELR